jgi:hypothetical protein
VRPAGVSRPGGESILATSTNKKGRLMAAFSFAF